MSLLFIPCTVDTYNNPHPLITPPHLIHQRPQRRRNLGRFPIPTKYVVGPQMNRDNVRRVPPQPVDNLVLGCNVDGHEAGVLRAGIVSAAVR